MQFSCLVCIHSSKVSSQYLGKRQSASVVTIQLNFETLIAEVIASFLGEFEVLEFLIILIASTKVS